MEISINFLKVLLERVVVHILCIRKYDCLWCCRKILQLILTILLLEIVFSLETLLIEY